MYRYLEALSKHRRVSKPIILKHRISYGTGTLRFKCEEPDHYFFLPADSYSAIAKIYNNVSWISNFSNHSRCISVGLSFYCPLRKAISYRRCK